MELGNDLRYVSCPTFVFVGPNNIIMEWQGIGDKYQSVGFILRSGLLIIDRRGIFGCFEVAVIINNLK